MGQSVHPLSLLKVFLQKQCIMQVSSSLKADEANLHLHYLHMGLVAMDMKFKKTFKVIPLSNLGHSNRRWLNYFPVI